VTIEVTEEMLEAFTRGKRSGGFGTGTAGPEPGIAAVLAIIERDYLSVLADLVDPDPCWFDHHGGCQAHGYLSLEPGELCPHEQAKLLLGTSVDS
jgi:hypothetical protein